MFKKILPLVVLSSLVVGCTASPTGRNQVLLYSSSDMTQLGAQSFEQIKQQEKINTDPKLNNYLFVTPRDSNSQSYTSTFNFIPHLILLFTQRIYSFVVDKKE